MLAGFNSRNTIFLVYINDIPDGLQSIVKLFSDDTSLFKVLFDYIISSSLLNNDLRLIANWAFKWKMLFNPDPSKQAVEIIFSTNNHYQASSTNI